MFMFNIVITYKCVFLQLTVFTYCLRFISTCVVVSIFSLVLYSMVTHLTVDEHFLRILYIVGSFSVYSIKIADFYEVDIEQPI